MAAVPERASTTTPARAPTNPALGRAIRRLRQHQDLTIEALAHAADLHPTYLSGIERGRRNPTWAKLCALADALGIPISTVAAEAEHDTCPVCGAPGTEQR
ncbi:MAG TPA: helix-turn-helix transcriptional regulator [Solirubrobacteraceae bacterium]|nr:helix-turn-helix transcriptional regulator [Solirubrobacteraceae bacterium]